MKKITIAIDGHSSCGKSTMAKDLAREVGYVYVDTGAMYRSVTLFALRKGLFKEQEIDVAELQRLMPEIHISFKFNPQTGRPDTYLNGELVEQEIRSMEVSSRVSPIAALGFVREALVAQQQQMGQDGGVVMDGRDIGTVVFPNAELKVFVTASAEVRAQRRFDELKAKGMPADYDDILKNVQERDYIDSHREVSPLRQAPDALLLDNSCMTIGEQKQWLLDRFRERSGKKPENSSSALKHLVVLLAFFGCLCCSLPVVAQAPALQDSAATLTTAAALPDTATAQAMVVEDDMLGMEAEEQGGVHKLLKTKFIEGSTGFMSLVALALVLGLAFCIERIIYLTLSEINAKKFMADVDARIEADDIEGAKQLCRETRGPVASICYQGLLRIHESLDSIERSIVSYGSVQTANLEKGCTWITLFIALAPSLGFLGTVIGMVMAFDQIQQAGDISTSIVAEGMKVALITTIFGIIVAVVLQLFYNFILSKIEHLTSQMEESAITLMDAITRYKEEVKA